MDSFDVFENEAEVCKKDLIDFSELEKLEISEDLSDIDRSIKLLKDGLKVQKVSALLCAPKVLSYDNPGNNISTLVLTIKNVFQQVEEKEIVLAVFDSLINMVNANIMGESKITFDDLFTVEDSELEANISLIELKNRQECLLTSQQIVSHILPLALVLFREADDIDYIDKKTFLMVSIITRITNSAEYKQIIRVTLESGDISRPDPDRIACSRILGAIATCSSTIPSEVFDKMISLCQDTTADVRMIMCLQLRDLSKAVGVEKTNREILPELIELFQDEEEKVKRMAYRVIISLLSFLPKEERKNQILPRLYKLIQNPPESFAVLIAKTFGTFMYELSLCGELEKDCFSEVHQAFETMSKNNQINVRRLCAFNFPGVLISMGESQYAPYLDEIYQDLANDTEIPVRHSIAAGIHQVAKILGSLRSLRYLKQIILNLLSDESIDIRCEILSNLPDLIIHFDKIVDADLKITAFEKIINGIIKHDTSIPLEQWRKSLQLLNTLEIFPDYFPSMQLYDGIIPILFRHLQESAKPVQVIASKLIVKFMRKNENSTHRQQLLNRIRQDYAKGVSSWQRSLYLDLCSFTIEYNSREYCAQNFLEPAIDLMEDPVPNVRIKTIPMIQTWKKLLSRINNTLLLEKLNRLEDKLKNDSDKDVLDYITIYNEPSIDIFSNTTCTRATNDDDDGDNIKLQQEEALSMTNDFDSSSLDPKWSDMLDLSGPNRKGNEGNKTGSGHKEVKRPSNIIITKANGKRASGRAVSPRNSLPNCADAKRAVELKNGKIPPNISTRAVKKTDSLSKIPNIAPTRPTATSPTGLTKVPSSRGRGSVEGKKETRAKVTPIAKR